MSWFDAISTARVIDAIRKFLCDGEPLGQEAWYNL